MSQLLNKTDIKVNFTESEIKDILLIFFSSHTRKIDLLIKNCL